MKIEEIKELINLINNSNLSELKVEMSDGTKFELKKETEISHNDENSKVVKKVDEVKEVVSTKTSGIQEVSNENSKIVTSPIVGTFYSKPSQDAKAYVEVGQEVKKGDVLCIIESMKLMNEIECEYSGKISKIHVQNEDMVDYGKPLFEII